ncbi:MAG: hypothetical protein Q8L86_07050 [Vicinamibacterales bacterium]|nr:hypothetical protein [Vicinamibacterales bacterium]
MHWLRVLFVVILLPHPSLAGALDDDPTRAPRLRPRDAAVARLLHDGLDRSEAMRTLVRRIEASDVIVYIESEPRLSGHVVGGITWVAQAGPVRYLRVSISPRLRGDAAVATLGHELQHVVEVIDAPHVDSSLAMLTHFREIGHSRSREGHTWDTTAAQAMGQTVRRDLGRTAASTWATSGAGQFRDWKAWYRHQLGRGADGPRDGKER